MGVITALLIAGGFLDSESFVVPIWVILGAATAIAIGTFLGGWRIVKIMAFKLTQLRPYQGFCAETGGGAILTSMAWFGISVSATHAISGPITGVGAPKDFQQFDGEYGKRLIICMDNNDTRKRRNCCCRLNHSKLCYWRKIRK